MEGKNKNDAAVVVFCEETFPSLGLVGRTRLLHVDLHIARGATDRVMHLILRLPRLE